MYFKYILVFFSLRLSVCFLLKFTQVGRIKCPLLLVNGDDDQTFPAVESAEDVSHMPYLSVSL